MHNEELHNLYSSPSIIRIMKSRRMRWTGYVAGMVRRGMHIGYWWESQKERDYCGKLRCRRVDNIKMDLRYDGVVWTASIWLRMGTGAGEL
jgi:hypothetical protein